MLVFPLRHHAYIVIGERSEVLIDLKSQLSESLGKPLEGHPDVFIADYDLLTVDNSRKLKSLVSGKALAGDNKFILVSIGSATNQAQNALLKVLEEPTLGTYIFLLASSKQMFLPTILSRVEVLFWRSGGEVRASDEVVSFLTATAGNRTSLINTWHKEELLTKNFLARFLDGLEYLSMRSEMASSCRGPIVLARRYLYDSSVLPKLVLEYLSVALPSMTKI